jgi:hypothetical protein
MKSSLLWTISSLLLFVAVEAAIFRSGRYDRYLEPHSSAGTVASYIYWLGEPDPVKVPEVFVIGDSRMAEGFSAPVADSAVGKRVHFWNFGMAGTTPRVWYYVLRDADPTRRRFSTIVIPIDLYADVDGGADPSDRLTDLYFSITRLRLSDCAAFAGSMVSFDHKELALSGCLFKGVTLRSDVQAFLYDRRDRIKSSEDWRKNGVAYLNDYGGRPENLEGLTADFEHRIIHYPPGLTEAAKDVIADRLTPEPAPQRGEMTRYRERWLTPILDLYKDSPTRIVLFELARGPLPKPENREPATWLQSALKHPRVVALPQNTFRDLERPELFFDGLHFNRAGRRLFSERLAQLVGSR